MVKNRNEFSAVEMGKEKVVGAEVREIGRARSHRNGLVDYGKVCGIYAEYDKEKVWSRKVTYFISYSKLHGCT